jgi:hypothetical protein
MEIHRRGLVERQAFSVPALQRVANTDRNVATARNFRAIKLSLNQRFVDLLVLVLPVASKNYRQPSVLLPGNTVSLIFFKDVQI